VIGHEKQVRINCSSVGINSSPQILCTGRGVDGPISGFVSQKDEMFADAGARREPGRFLTTDEPRWTQIYPLAQRMGECFHVPRAGGKSGGGIG
jgi:hypothetical protein